MVERQGSSNSMHYWDNASDALRAATTLTLDCCGTTPWGGAGLLMPVSLGQNLDG